jgi:4-hydroxyphenylpyruvate dioxygenase
MRNEEDAMTKREPIGIKRLEAMHYYVHDLERSRRFYTEKLDFAEVAVSTPELEERGKQRSALFQAGDCKIMCSEPLGEGGRAYRYLKRHPDGVGTLVFEVEDIEMCFRLVEERGGTPIENIETMERDGGYLRTFSITTPFGSSTFRFVERKSYPDVMPGLSAHEEPKGGKNTFGFSHFDHITSNFETMSPALLWMEHVLGFEEYWKVQFHTDDVTSGAETGSGLKSRVMWDPHSGVKFANNEPMRPYFKDSQINIFTEDNRGDGIQHGAMIVKDIVTAVRGMRERGVQFMHTPGAYYDMLPERLETSGIKRIDEDIETLRQLGILVDGREEHQYMLQIFLQDSAGTHHDPNAGPFFFEIIERKGDNLFGEGNFRALFESIERQQKAERQTD